MTDLDAAALVSQLSSLSDEESILSFYARSILPAGPNSDQIWSDQALFVKFPIKRLKLLSSSSSSSASSASSSAQSSVSSDRYYSILGLYYERKGDLRRSGGCFLKAKNLRGLGRTYGARCLEAPGRDLWNEWDYGRGQQKAVAGCDIIRRFGGRRPADSVWEAPLVHRPAASQRPSISWLDVAGVYYDQEMYGSAVDTCKMYRGERKRECGILLGCSLWRGGNFGEGWETLKQLLEEGSGDEGEDDKSSKLQSAYRCCLDYAKSLREQGKEGVARKVLLDGLQLQQEAGLCKPEGHKVRGDMESFLERYDDAKASYLAFCEAIQSDSERAAWSKSLPSAYYDVGFSYYKLSDFSMAQAYMYKAVLEDPSLPNAWNGLGVVLSAKGNTDASLRCFDISASCSTSSFADCWINKALALKNFGMDHSEATANLSKVQDDPAIWLLGGQLDGLLKAANMQDMDGIGRACLQLLSNRDLDEVKWRKGQALSKIWEGMGGELGEAMVIFSPDSVAEDPFTPRLDKVKSLLRSNQEPENLRECIKILNAIVAESSSRQVGEIEMHKNSDAKDKDVAAARSALSPPASLVAECMALKCWLDFILNKGGGNNQARRNDLAIAALYDPANAFLEKAKVAMTARS